MRKKVFLACVSSFTLAATLSAASITDGTFATPSVATAPNGFLYNPTGSAWTFTGASGVAAQGQPGFAPWYTVTAPGGSGQAAFIQNYFGSNTAFNGKPGIISQSISGLAIGDQYTLSFFAALRPNYSVNPFTVSVGGTQIDLVTPTTTSFASYLTSFTATNSTELLTFASTPGPSTGNFDFDSIIADVTLGPNTVTTPEPSTFVLLLPALAGLALYGRRRASRKANIG